MIDRVTQDDFEPTDGTDLPPEQQSPTPADDSDAGFVPAIPSGEGEIQGALVVLLPEGVSRGDAVRILTKDIPLNQFGLPEFFIRSDLLNFNGYISQDDVDAASIGLFYQEGYPTTEDGRAFWNQLPHEPMQAYLLFQKYISQAESQGIRQLELLAVEEDVDLEILRQYSLEFYWSPRARAYDLFIIAAETRKRQIRTRKMENKHYDKAGELLAGLEKKFETDDWWEELSAKEAIELVDVLVKIQRLSLGLTGMNASSLPKQPLPEGASPQQMLEQLTKGSQAGNRDTEGFQARLESFLADDDQGMQVQEAILRLTRPTQAPNTNRTGFEED
jgi:hypothetical protein